MQHLKMDDFITDKFELAQNLTGFNITFSYNGIKYQECFIEQIHYNMICI